MKQINFDVHYGYGGPFWCVPYHSGVFRSIPVIIPTVALLLAGSHAIITPASAYFEF